MVLTRSQGGAWWQTATMSDLRLEGDWYQTWETDSYGVPRGEDGPAVHVVTLRIENAEGAWEGGWFGADSADGTPVGDPPWVVVGEGAYEGLMAIAAVSAVMNDPCALDFRGVIFDGVPPQVPYRPA
jgi:hypothetical protein